MNEIGSPPSDDLIERPAPEFFQAGIAHFNYAVLYHADYIICPVNEGPVFLLALLKFYIRKLTVRNISCNNSHPVKSPFQRISRRYFRIKPRWLIPYR